MTTTYQNNKAPLTRATGEIGKPVHNTTERPLADHLQPTEAMTAPTRAALRNNSALERRTGLKAHQPNIVLALTALVIFFGGLMEFKEVQPENAAAFKLECPLIPYTNSYEDGEPAAPGAKRQICTWVAAR